MNKFRGSRAAVTLFTAIVLAALLLIVAIVWGIRTIGDRTENNCVRIHRVVKTIDTIIASGDAQTRKYVQEGLLTPEQAARSDVYRAKQRAVLATADCQP